MENLDGAAVGAQLRDIGLVVDGMVIDLVILELSGDLFIHAPTFFDVRNVVVDVRDSTPIIDVDVRVARIVVVRVDVGVA